MSEGRECWVCGGFLPASELNPCSGCLGVGVDAVIAMAMAIIRELDQLEVDIHDGYSSYIHGFYFEDRNTSPWTVDKLSANRRKSEPSQTISNRGPIRTSD